MRKTRRRTGRKLWRALHLALALIAGLGFAFLGVTGSLLVFSKEIDAALNPELFTRRSSLGEHGAISSIAAAVTHNLAPGMSVDCPGAGTYGVMPRHAPG